MSQNLAQIIIDKYFQDNPLALVQHHINSYNDFFDEGIKRIFKEKNPIRIMKEQDTKTQEFKRKCNLYLGGKNGDKLYYGKPVIYDAGREHFMYPNEARLRNMSYSITIHYDVDVEYFISEDGETAKEPSYSHTLEKIYLGRFPIMLMSNLCILKELTPSVRFEMGECRNDYGGYFIIDGKEKCIVSQEKFADNMLYIRDKVNDLYSYSADIRSVSEDASKPVRTVSVRMVAPSATYTNNQIVINIPNVRKPVPLFILMRALGIESDKKIIEYCLLNTEKYKTYKELFIPSIYDAGSIFTQETAIKYIATFTKGKTVPHALEILTNYFLPHIGEMNFQNKAYFVGHMVKELLKVYTNDTKPTDRDSFRFKRVELPGSLIYDLFKEYYTLQQRNIFQKFDKLYYYGQKKERYTTPEQFKSFIELNYKDGFKDRVVENGFKKAFKGNWGSEEHTKRLGVVQDLNRLSYNSAISQLRKLNLPLDSSAKVVGPRLLHSSQWGIIDPVDTPDGGNVGLHKHLSIAAYITSGCSSQPMFTWLRKHANLRLLTESTPFYLSTQCKVIVNGNWIGIIGEPVEIEKKIKKYRRNGLIPVYTSINWDITNNILYIYTDSGRLCRPVYYMDGIKPSYDKKSILEKLEKNSFTWEELVTGFAKKKGDFNILKHCLYMDVNELYGSSDINTLSETQAIIEYIDTSEEEGALIAINSDKLKNNNEIKKPKKYYTHMEIHPSLIFGVMGNQVIFPENNPLPRDLFACGQMRQAVSLYHSNFQTRIDKMGVVLNNGQIPLVKSRYLEKINKEQHPYGENLIVAIMCYGGYNVEDSILFNEGSVKRGMFRTTYYNMYESREESSTIGNSTVNSRFANIEDNNVVGLKPGFDYGDLDKNGLIKENTLLDDKKVLIGKIITNLSNPKGDVSGDSSVFPKKGQKGYVDKAFITEGSEGYRIAKIRVRDERIPNIGDKFCSRCGQKGTIGLVIPEINMPFTEEGIRPDIIINPHALPSRMTIGQLVESQMAKACSLVGGFGDCTAFMNKGPKDKIFGEMLKENGFNSSGCQLMYNGESGEQMKAEIYIGVTYYMRLKHMVKDKINYRARGPRTVLTRQTVQGRANDGGLRVGEMERDGIAANGMSKFLQESMLVRGDEYYMAICNQTGMIAIYNESYNLFLSPVADGPIHYGENLDEGLNIENITRFGRSFSILRIPYAFKLLIQELQTMNIQLRIITEKNIDQLTSMSFSNNITKLLGEEASISEVANAARISSRTGEDAKIIRQRNKAEMKPFEPKIIKEDKNLELNITEKSIEKPLEKPRIRPETLGWYRRPLSEDGEVSWGSLIVGFDGKESETIWFEDSHDFEPPKQAVKGWNLEEAKYTNGESIPIDILTFYLSNDRTANNWSKAIQDAKSAKEETLDEISPPYNPNAPPVQAPPSPPYNPNAPPVQAPPSPPYNPLAQPVQAPPSPPYNPLAQPVQAPPSPPYNPNAQPVQAPPSPPYNPLAPPIEAPEEPRDQGRLPQEEESNIDDIKDVPDILSVIPNTEKVEEINKIISEAKDTKPTSGGNNSELPLLMYNKEEIKEDKEKDDNNIKKTITINEPLIQKN